MPDENWQRIKEAGLALVAMLEAQERGRAQPSEAQAQPPSQDQQGGSATQAGVAPALDVSLPKPQFQTVEPDWTKLAGALKQTAPGQPPTVESPQRDRQQGDWWPDAPTSQEPFLALPYDVQPRSQSIDVRQPEGRAANEPATVEAIVAALRPLLAEQTATIISQLKEAIEANAGYAA